MQSTTLTFKEACDRALAIEGVVIAEIVQEICNFTQYSRRSVEDMVKGIKDPPILNTGKSVVWHKGIDRWVKIRFNLDGNYIVPSQDKPIDQQSPPTDQQSPLNVFGQGIPQSDRGDGGLSNGDSLEGDPPDDLPDVPPDQSKPKIILCHICEKDLVPPENILEHLAAHTSQIVEESDNDKDFQEGDFDEILWMPREFPQDVDGTPVQKMESLSDARLTSREFLGSVGKTTPAIVGPFLAAIGFLSCYTVLMLPIAVSVSAGLMCLMVGTIGIWMYSAWGRYKNEVMEAHLITLPNEGGSERVLVESFPIWKTALEKVNPLNFSVYNGGREFWAIRAKAEDAWYTFAPGDALSVLPENKSRSTLAVALSHPFTEAYISFKSDTPLKAILNLAIIGIGVGLLIFSIIFNVGGDQASMPSIPTLPEETI